MRAPAIALLAIIAACTQGAPVELGTVTPDYTIGGGDWNSGGGITIAAQVTERNGRTVVCGAWATDRQGAVTVGLNGEVIQAASVFAGDARLVQNLNFMARAPSPDRLAGAQANCVAVADSAAGPARIVTPRMQFQLDEETGLVVSFRAGPRPNPLQ